MAGEHRIPIVENPPLARALHATVEIDQEIPPEHYKAVAEVIGYVMRLRRLGAAANCPNKGAHYPAIQPLAPALALIGPA